MASNPTSSTRRFPIKSLALLTSLFCLGAVAGAGGMALVATKRLQSEFRENMLQPDRSPGPADRLFDRMEKGISSELELSDTQRAAVAKELGESRIQLRAARAEVRDELRRIVRDTVTRVNGSLPEVKRPRFREMAERRLRPWGMESLANP